jgi:hypothetical protein
MGTIDWKILVFVLNALWQVPLAIGVGLLGDRLLHRSPARLRHLLWLVVLGVAVALPLMAGLGPFLSRPAGHAVATLAMAPAR